MKLLLDENLPKRLKSDFPEHEIYTVRDMGWDGQSNGALMQSLIAAGFDVLLTFDKNLQYQQNFDRYQIPVLVLNASNNTYVVLKELVSPIKKILRKTLKPGPIEVTSSA